MYQNYQILITGGTSEGPYTIYFDEIDSSHIALIYLDYIPATNLTLSQMQSGVSVTVPDGTYNIIVYNQLCGTNQTIPVQDAIKTYNFCLQIDPDTMVQFISYGEYDGNQSWYSNDSTYFAYFDNSINKWKVSGGTLSYTILNASSYPPLSGWYTVGGGQGDLISYSGTCSGELPSEMLSMTISVNNPSCECDGTIAVTPSGGVPPYSISIDNGVTWNSNKSLFNDLCEGSYSVVVMDSNGQTYSQSVILSNVELPVTYTVSLNTTSTIITNTNNQLTKQYTTTVNVSPALPVGVTLTFDLQHTNLFKSSIPTTCYTYTLENDSSVTPLDYSYTRCEDGNIYSGILYLNDIIDVCSFENSVTIDSGGVITQQGACNTNQLDATLVNNNILNKNGFPQSSPTTTEGVSYIPNIINGCQNRLVYVRTTNDTWGSVTMTQLDTLVINTTTTVTWTNSDCLVAEATDTYQITNLSINGCSCCSAVIEGK